MKSVQEYSWGSGPLLSGEEETNSLCFTPEAGQGLPVATTYIALASCAVRSGTAFPNLCVPVQVVGTAGMPCPAPCLNFPAWHFDQLALN